MTQAPTAEQQAIIDDDAKTLIAVAGPGTGKTYVSIARAIRLAKAGEHVLMTTFTVSARMEIEKRLDNHPELIASPALRERIQVMTCGAIAWLTVHEGAPEIRQIGSGASISRLRALMKEMGRNPASEADEIEAAQKGGRAINSVREFMTGLNLLTANNIREHDPEIPEDYQELYSKWIESLTNDNVRTMPMMTVEAWKLLRAGNVPARLRLTTHILVDEAQDLNQSQYDMLRALESWAPPGRGKMTLVGDGEQAIYSWRGAIPGLMQGIGQDKATTKLLSLTESWRSGRMLLRPAVTLVNSIDGVHKTMTARTKGEAPIIRPRRNIRDEAKFAAERIAALMEGGEVPLHEISVIGRSHRVLNDIFTALSKKGIPLCYAGNQFFSRPEYKAIRLAVAFMSGEPAATILPKLAHVLTGEKCHPDAVEELKNAPNIPVREMLPILLRGTNARKTAAFRRAIGVMAERATIKEDKFADAFRSMVRSLDLQAAVKKNPAGRFVNHTLHDLMDMAESYSSFEEFQIALDEREATQQGQRPIPGHVFIGTPFAVKGLEFHSVIIIGLNEGIFPSARADDSMTDYRYDVARNGGVDEEKRMLFVAMTRAKTYLAMTYSRNTVGGAGGVARELAMSHFLYMMGLKTPL